MPGVMGSPGNIIRDGADGSSSASYAEGHWFESSSRTQRVMVTLSKNCQGRVVGTLSKVKTPMAAPPARSTTQAVCRFVAKKGLGQKAQMAQNNPPKPALYKGARTGNHYGQAGNCRICPVGKWMGFSDPAVKIGRKRHAI